MKWIGLTGGIATGKSTVAMILRDLGLPVVDADHLAREVVKRDSTGLAEVITFFGSAVLDAEGNLDRKKMGAIIFSDENKRQHLEDILHPRIQELRAKERRDLEQLGFELAFYDVPLLFEKNLEKEFDATVLVYCSAEEQKKRLKERDHLNDIEIENRLRAQIPIDEKLKRANYVIMNTGAPSDLKRNVISVLHDIRSKNA